MDGEPKWTRETLWRQGHVLTTQAALAAGLWVDDKTCIVAISHDCDLANDVELEPNVEIIVGRLVATANGNFCWGKSPWTLHLTITREGLEIIVELVMTNKRSLAKRLLAGFNPDGAFTLDGQRLGVLRAWLSARYNRAAFPDSFVDRMRKTKLDGKLAKVLEPQGQLISFVYFDIDRGQNLEREEGDPYELSIVLVYYPGDEPDSAEEHANTMSGSLRDAFEKKLASGRIISLKNCFAISEDDISVSQARTLLQ
jgi:hypothetical protein